MDEICRLCCSSTFVRHEIFGPEGELYTRMWPFLFAPLRVRRDDGLPQRVCRTCHARVLQLQQFCSEAQCAQTRLRELVEEVLSPTKSEPKTELEPCWVDVSSMGCERVKQTVLLQAGVLWADCATQTEDVPWTNSATQTEFEMEVEDKISPNPPSWLLRSFDALAEDTLCEPSTTFVETKDENSSISELQQENNSAYSIMKDDSNSSGHHQGSDSVDFVESVDPKEELQALSDSDDDEPLAKLRKRTIKKSAQKTSKKSKARKKTKEHNSKKDQGGGSKDKVYEIKTDESESDEEVKSRFGRRRCHNRFKSRDPYACWCCVCAKVLPSRAECLQHYESHLSEGPRPAPVLPPPKLSKARKCTHCNAKVEPRNWLVHWASHQKRPHYCQTCRISFKNFRNFIKHGVKYHANEKRKDEDRSNNYICGHCPRKFVAMISLRRHHLYAHDTDRPIKPRCARCAFKSSGASNMDAHIRDKHQTPRHLCQLCGKNFSRNYKLQQHLFVHTGEKPYKCRYCERGFASNNTLRGHELIHAGKKPHVCAVCSRGFVQRSALVTHMRLLHSRARPHACPHCGKGFVSRSLLNHHLKNPCGRADSGTDSD